MTGLPGVAYKVLTGPQMEELLAVGTFVGAPVDVADGYIHLSTAEQVTETVARHFRGQTGLHVAAVDLTALGDAVVWEPSRGGQLFPHVYSALPLSAVVGHAPLAYDNDGMVLLPSRI